MNVLKHLAGFALFSVILGSAIFINHFLTIPNAKIPSVSLRPLIADPLDYPHFTYEVRQVALDFNTVTGYTTVRLNLRPDGPAPEKLWVTTYYFSPEISHDVWTNTKEFLRPFANGDHVELTAADSLNRNRLRNMPRVAYFAQVYVFAGYAFDLSPPVRFDRNIHSAEPVVVHWPNAPLPPSPSATVEKLGR